MMSLPRDTYTVQKDMVCCWTCKHHQLIAHKRDHWCDADVAAWQAGKAFPCKPNGRCDLHEFADSKKHRGQRLFQGEQT